MPIDDYNREYMLRLFNSGNISAWDMSILSSYGIDIVCGDGKVVEIIKHRRSPRFNSEYYADSSLCWLCRCAVNGDEHNCLWADRFIAIDDWDVDEGVISTMVRECPEYKADYSAILRSIPE